MSNTTTLKTDFQISTENEEAAGTTTGSQPLLWPQQLNHEMVVSAGVVYVHLVQRVVGVTITIVGTAPCSSALPPSSNLSRKGNANGLQQAFQHPTDKNHNQQCPGYIYSAENQHKSLFYSFGSYLNPAKTLVYIFFSTHFHVSFSLYLAPFLQSSLPKYFPSHLPINTLCVKQCLMVLHFVQFSVFLIKQIAYSDIFLSPSSFFFFNLLSFPLIVRFCNFYLIMTDRLFTTVFVFLVWELHNNWNVWIFVALA